MSLLAATRRLLPPLSARGICTTGCFASHSALRKAPESPPRHAHMHAPNSLHVMRALVKDSPRPGLISTSVALPRVGPDDVMIKIRRTSLCGTDLQIYNWSPWSSRTVPTPLVIGHEYVGEVARVGGNVTGLEIGARVTGEGHITCGVCRNCRAGRRHLCCDTLGVGINRDGAFGEYLVIPHSNVFPLSDFISDETAAIMDPLGNAVHSVLSCSENLVGADVLITGAGPIGCMAAAICKMIGARKVIVTDVCSYRLNLAKECGADEAVDVSKEGNLGVRRAMARAGVREGFDVGLELSGKAPAMANILESMRNGGKISALGLPDGPVPLDMETLVFKSLELKGIFGREIWDTWERMASLLESGLQDKIAPVLTHTLPADDFDKGFEVMRTGQSGKVSLAWA